MKQLSILLLVILSNVLWGQSDIELNPSGIVLPRISKANKAGLNPVEGQLFYNPETKSLMLFTGSGWDRITSTAVSVYDIDGNSYDVVEIAGIKWTVQNLRATKFNDGTPIMKHGNASIREKDEIQRKNGSTTPFYTYYNNDSITYASTYGALYNHCAVATGNLCPVGWRVPSESDYLALDVALGGRSLAGGSMKEAGTTHWNAPNTGATNSSGFTGLPGGSFSSTGSIYAGLGESGYYWSSSVLTNNPNIATYRSMNFSNPVLFYEGLNISSEALSVRCIL